MRSKKGMTKLERFSLRATLLLLWCAFLGGLLWAERFAYYRYDYIFRLYLPYVLPAFAGLTLIGFVVAVLLLVKGKKPERERLVNLPFVIVLLVPLLLAFGLPACVMYGVGLNIFKLTTLLVFWFGMGYFISYLLYFLHSPAAAVRGISATLFSLVPWCYYAVYRSPSAAIMMSVQYKYLTPTGAAVAFSAGLLAVHLVGLLLGKMQKRFRTPRWVNWVAFALSVICLFALNWLPLGADEFLWLALGNLALQMAFLAVACLLKKTVK